MGAGLAAGVGLGVGAVGELPDEVDEALLPAERFPLQELKPNDRERTATARTQKKQRRKGPLQNLVGTKWRGQFKGWPASFDSDENPRSDN
jgi:hypothetical protein